MIKRVLNYLRQCSDLLLELHKREHVSMFFLWLDSTWALLKHGILIKQYTLGNIYKIPRVKMGGVLSQRRLETLIKQYNDIEYIHYLKNKNEFNAYFKEWVRRGWLYGKEMTEDEFRLLANDGRRLFVKPLDAQEGNGIRMITVNDAEVHNVFEALKKENVIIEEAIIQHDKMKFGNNAVNTVRVITCLDEHGKAHILRSALRVGVGNSVVDNFTAGGALYDIDIDYGVIDAKGIGHDYKQLIYHPGTEICMVGYQLPNWKILIESVIKAAEMLPQCRFIGWDVAITKEGIELIEGNHNPGLFTMESLGKPYSYTDAIKMFNS